MGPEKQRDAAKDPWPFRASFLPSSASQAGPCSLTLLRYSVKVHWAPWARASGKPCLRPPPRPGRGRSACLHHTPSLSSPLRGKEAAGAGVAAGASCPCDRAEPGIRGHVGKTLVPAALPARNAPPAPQPPPAWPRNGDSPAPCSCSHPLIAHPPQPSTAHRRPGRGLSSLPAFAPTGPATCLACGSSLYQSHNTEPDRTSWGNLRPPPQACLFSRVLLWLNTFLRLSPSGCLPRSRMTHLWAPTPITEPEAHSRCRKKKGVNVTC